VSRWPLFARDRLLNRERFSSSARSSISPSESVSLALAGGALGVAAAYWLVRGFVALDPIHLPRVQEVAVDGSVLLYAVAAAIVTGVLFGLAPALRASRPDLGNSLKENPGTPGAGEFGRNHGRSLLAAAQIALSIVLLVSAGVLLHSFVMRVSVPLGFRPEGVLGVELPWSANRRIDELLERLRALPGVQAAGAATAFPAGDLFRNRKGKRRFVPFAPAVPCSMFQGRRAARPVTRERRWTSTSTPTSLTVLKSSARVPTIWTRV
jgi:hypothetical protein